MMVNKRPVLIYHTRSAQVRVIVSISDIHLRDALYSDEDNGGLALLVQNQMIARYGDVKPLAADPHQEVFTSPAGQTPRRSGVRPLNLFRWPSVLG
ncbi:hypothetical protein [Klebsiella quasipneumoniae]|uniref:hypothetical protein n=1 Tax=Klebsiella quasipneumoniae TaxID=1463165 RepID=UPI00217D4695|nr:hypothetical protein [Klebsiella quasipneumoniae]